MKVRLRYIPGVIGIFWLDELIRLQFGTLNALGRFSFNKFSKKTAFLTFTQISTYIPCRMFTKIMLKIDYLF